MKKVKIGNNLMTIIPRINTNTSNPITSLPFVNTTVWQSPGPGITLPPSFDEINTNEIDSLLFYTEGLGAQKTLQQLVFNAHLYGKAEKGEWSLLQKLEEQRALGKNNISNNLIESVKTLFTFLDQFYPLSQKIEQSLMTLNQISFKTKDFSSALNAFSEFSAHLPDLLNLLKKYQYYPYPQTALSVLQKINEELRFIQNSEKSFLAALAPHMDQLNKGQKILLLKTLEKMGLSGFEPIAPSSLIGQIGTFGWDIADKLVHPWRTLFPEAKDLAQKERALNRQLLGSIAFDIKTARDRIKEVQLKMPQPDKKQTNPTKEERAYRNQLPEGTDLQKTVLRENIDGDKPNETQKSEDDAQEKRNELKRSLDQARAHAKKLSLDQELTIELYTVEKQLEVERPDTQALNIAELHLRKIYHAIACKQSKCSFELLKNILNQQIDLRKYVIDNNSDIPDRIFQHILGSYFGKGTQLEGIKSPIVLQYQLDYLQKRVEFLKADPHCTVEQDSFCKTLGLKGQDENIAAFETLVDQFRKAEKLGKEFREKSPNEFYQSIRSEMENLQEGKSFFFQGGWMNKSGGHSIVYEIIKESGDFFTLRVYNRGQGVEHHTRAILYSMEQFLPFTEIVQIPFENLARLPILKALYELDKPPTSNAEWEPLNLYQVILPQLKGKISSNTYTSEQLMENIEVGHCSYLSLTGLVNQFFHSSQKYGRWEFELQFHTLVSYFQQHSGTDHFETDERAQRLVRKGAEQFGRTALEAFRKGIISLDEMVLVNQKVAEIRSHIAEAEKKFLQNKAEQVKPPFILTPIDAEWKDASGELAIFKERAIGDAAAEINVIKFDLKRFNKDLKEYRKEFSKELTSTVSTGTCLSIKAAIQEIALQIPLEEIERIGTKFTLREGMEMISQMTELGKDFLFSVMRANQFEQNVVTSPADYLTVIKLLTIADSLSQTFSDTKKFPGTTCVAFKDLYQVDMQNFLEGKSGSIHLFDAKLEAEVRVLRTYWEKRGKPDDGVSFFGFEKFPASTFFTSEMTALQTDVYRTRMLTEDPKETWSYWDLGIKWKDLAWAEEWIKTNSFYEKIKKLMPFLAKQEARAQTISLLYDDLSNLPKSEDWSKEKRKQLQQDLFPQTFFDLRDLSFTVDFLLKNDWDTSKVTLDRTQGFTTKAIAMRNHCSPSQSYWKIQQIIPFGVKLDEIVINKGFNQNKEKTDKSNKNNVDEKSEQNKPPGYLLSTGDKGPRVLLGNYFLDQSQDTLSTEMNPYYYGNQTADFDQPEYVRRRIDPQELPLLSRKTLNPAKSLQESKEILALSGIPSQQILNTFGYFKKRSELLQKPEYQNLFKKLMFEPPLLLEMLGTSHGQAFAEKLGKFCRNGYQYALKDKDYPVASFFLEISHLFSAEIKEAGKRADFPYARKEFSKLLDLPDLTIKFRTRAYFGLLQTYSGRQPPEISETADLLAATIWAGKSTIKPEKEFASRAMEHSIRDVAYRFQRDIQNALKVNRDQILNRVVERITFKKFVGKWKQDGAFYKSEDGQFQINPFEAQLFEELGSEKPIAPLPHKVLSRTPEIGKLLTGGAKEIAPGQYICEGQLGERYKLIDPADGSGVIVQREIGGRWFRLIEPPKTLPKSLNYCHFWIRTEREAPEAEEPDMLWKMIGYSAPPPKPPELWLSEKRSGEIVYEIEIEKVSSKIKKKNQGTKIITVHEVSYHPKAVHRLAEGKRTGLILANPKHLTMLKNVEDVQYLQPWVRPDSMIPEILDMPRLRLTFSISKGKAACDQYKGYFIAEQQHVPALGDLQHYLVLEKENSAEKLILFPVQQFQEQDKGSLVTDAVPDRRLSDEERLAGSMDGPYFRLLSYDLKDGQVKARNEAGRLYLAMLRLWKQDLSCKKEPCYFEANKLLCWYGSQTRPYNTEEEDILKWTISLEDYNHDQDPKSIAVRLKAGYWLVKNRVDFREGLKKNDKTWIDRLSKLYENALQKRSRTPIDLRLSEEEDKFLLLRISEYLKQELPLGKARLGELQGEKPKDLKPLGIENLKRLKRSKPNKTEKTIEKTVEEFIGHLRFVSGPTPNQSLLHASGLLAEINDLYKLARDKQTVAGFVELYEKITGIVIDPHLDFPTLYSKIKGREFPANKRVVHAEAEKLEILKEEILFSLNLIMVGNSEDDEAAAAALLTVVIQNPKNSLNPVSFEENRIKLNVFRPLERAEALQKLSDKYQEPMSKVWNKALESSVLPFDYGNGHQSQFDPKEQRGLRWAQPYPKSEQCAAIDPISSAIPAIDWYNRIPFTEIDRQVARERGLNVSKLFDIETQDRVVSKQLAELKDKLTEFSNSEDAVYSIKPNQSYVAGEKKLNVWREIELKKINLREIENKLIELVNKAPVCSAASLLNGHHPLFLDQEQTAELLSGDRRSIETEELLYLFVTQDINNLRERNPALSDSEIKEVYSLTQEFLTESTAKQHLERFQSQYLRIEQLLERCVSTRDRLESIIFDEKDRPPANLVLVKGVLRKLSLESLYRNRNAIEEFTFFPDLGWFGGQFYDLAMDLNEQITLSGSEVVELNDYYEKVVSELNHSFQDLIKTSFAKRAYSIAQHPEYLVFEYYMDVLLWEDQVQNIEKLDWHDTKGFGTALEMIMGRGKTSTLLPLLAIRNADGKKASLLVMPQHMIGSTSTEMQKRLKDGLNQLIEVFDFKRGRYDLYKLTRIDERLVSAIKGKKAILMSGSSLQTLFLQFIETFINSADLPVSEAKARGDELSVYRKTFSRLRDSGDLTLDELDFLLDLLKYHHFTLGDGSPIHSDVIQSAADLYQLLITDPDLAMKWNFAPTASQNAKIFTGSNYADLKPIIIEKVLAGQVRREVLGSFLSKASQSQKTVLRNYLGAKPGDYPFLSEAPPAVRNTLAVLKEEINTIIPLTVNKQVDEHYGAIPVDAVQKGNSRHMAIPFHGSNNPMVRSQFGTELEIIHYTIQLHLAKGIGEDVIQQRIEQLKVEAAEERKKGIADEYNRAVLEFRRIGGTDQISLAYLSREDTKKICQFINKDRLLQFEFIKNAILPDLKVYDKQLKTSSHIFPLLVKQVKGCSGTLWNARSYPEALTRLVPSNTEAKTLICLWENNLDPNKEILKLPEAAPQNMTKRERIRRMLEPMYEKTKGSLIDLGGVFRGIDNIEVAREMLALAKKNPAIKGVAYLDKQDRIMVLIPGKDNGIDLKESGLSKNDILAYWSQKDTTGIDIPIHPEMTATVTVGSHTMMRDLLQAVWRLRGLDKEQKVAFAILPEDLEVISTTLSKDLQKDVKVPLELKDLFLYAKYLEALRQGDDNYRALREKMDAVLIEPLLKALLTDMNGNQGKADLLLTPLVEQLFVIKKEKDPFALYGGIDKMIPAGEAVEEEVLRARKILKQIETALKELKIPFEWQKAQNQINQIAERQQEHLPDLILKKESNRPKTEVQLENQLNVNIEEVDDVETEEPVFNPRPVLVWPKKDCYSINYFNKIPHNNWGRKPSLKVVYHSSDLNQMVKSQAEKMSRSKGEAPLVSVKEVLFHSSKYSEIFDDNLFGSMNLMPIHPPRYKERHYQLFSRYQEESRQALIVLDKKRNEIKYVMLNAWDALQWETLIAEKPDAANPDLAISLYHWDAGVYAQIGESLDDKPQFLSLHVQAKFFSGELAYSEKERPVLKAWIKKNESMNMKTFFINHILQSKEESQKIFEGSDLGKLFKELE